MNKIHMMILSGACACLIGIGGIAGAACEQSARCAPVRAYCTQQCRSLCGSQLSPAFRCSANQVEPTCAPIAIPTAAPGAAPTYAPSAKPTAAPTKVPAGSISASLASQVLAIANTDRAGAGLGALTMDDNLTRAAQIRAQEIVGSFSHTRPDGSSFSTVTAGAYAENIAKGQRSAERVMAAWMSSDGHRKNILNGRYTKIGICAYEHNGIMYWVQLFGR